MAQVQIPKHVLVRLALQEPDSFCELVGNAEVLILRRQVTDERRVVRCGEGNVAVYTVAVLGVPVAELLSEDGGAHSQQAGEEGIERRHDEGKQIKA